MKRFRPILVAIVAGAVLLVGAGLWVTMPYPLWMLWQARGAARYSSEWPVTEWDYSEAKRLVDKRLEFREIITSVHAAPDEIIFETLVKYDSPNRAGIGNRYWVKKIDGQWKIATRAGWMN